ncbi:hypothetical protein B5G18_12505 [Clostridium perfringens]|uniref:phospholipase D family protein n=1 Tax=Clostridium perfringens TaxID=1502 RepID=UPI000B37AC17|nr:phospholipase D family protein [Clostridium perfringens]OUN51697.1 hypothetical protein B5G18_12505 [Clostridium perfringens]OUP43386.1 hypothetical protein B5F20_13405 [Clostridium perfringens]
MLGSFYWHSKVDNGNNLRDELFNIQKISNVKIASAYFSKEGLEIIKKIKDKYLLNNKNIDLYLSQEFSVDKPYELLEELKKICNVYIVFNIRFHPKVYWLKSSSKSKLIFGSSNFTRGGFSENIEFDMISEIDEKDEEKLDMFFKYCNSNSELVNDEIINFYRDKEEDFNKLKNINKKITNALYSYEKRNDLFREEDYELSDMYFTFEDYETLFFRNQSLDNKVINLRRKKVRDKILKIHSNVYLILNKENIHCHWITQNITSLIRPCEFNFGRVGWIGVRYGKSKEEIDILNIGSSKNESLGFQKHSCLQFSIIQNGFEINLFHAVRRDAVDRGYLHENINKLKDKIIIELDKLKGEGFKWIIHTGEENKDYVFNIDDEKSEDFIKFYNRYDEEGRESYLSYYLEPDDYRLENIDSISKVVVEKMKLLVPLYNLLAFRIK